MTAVGIRVISIAAWMAWAFISGPAWAEDYKLGVSDRVKVKVQERPELNGDYSVSANGFVALPLIGNVKVAGRTVEYLENEISDRLQSRSEGAERPVAAVEIAQYRPFSIIGDVQRPGDYPFQPGLTVLRAVGLAGGYYRPEFGLLRIDRDLALAKGETRALLLKQKRLIARRARLTAALEGRVDVPIPPEFDKQRDDPEISAIIQSERAELAVQNETARSEQAGFENLKGLYLREIGSLKGQIDGLKQEESSIQQQLNEFRSLSAKGLALMPTVFSLTRSLGEITNEKMSAEAAIVRANENISLAEQKLRERSQERNRANTRDLQETNDQIGELHARIRTQGDLITEAEISAPAEARARLESLGQRSGFTVLRRDGEAMREISLDETSLVLPDDIIKVPTIHPGLYGSGVNLSRAEGPGEADISSAR